MFSIKIVDKDGYEFVKSDVMSVTYNPPFEQGGASVFAWYKDRESESFYSGKIYVMNENGKTIADYHIYSNPVPMSEGQKG